MVKKSACHYRRYKRHGFNPWVRKIPWSRKWQPIPVFLPGKSHGQKSLAGYSPQGHKESDTTKHTYTHAVLQIQRTNGSLLITIMKKLILHMPVTRPERNRSLEGLSLAINCSE